MADETPWRVTIFDISLLILIRALRRLRHTLCHGRHRRRWQKQTMAPVNTPWFNGITTLLVCKVDTRWSLVLFRRRRRHYLLAYDTSVVYGYRRQLIPRFMALSVVSRSPIRRRLVTNRNGIGERGENMISRHEDYWHRYHYRSPPFYNIHVVVAINTTGMAATGLVTTLHRHGRGKTSPARNNGIPGVVGRSLVIAGVTTIILFG